MRPTIEAFQQTNKQTNSRFTFSVIKTLQGLLWVFQVRSFLVFKELCRKGVFLVVVFLRNHFLSCRDGGKTGKGQSGVSAAGE